MDKTIEDSNDKDIDNHIDDFTDEFLQHMTKTYEELKNNPNVDIKYVNELKQLIEDVKKKDIEDEDDNRYYYNNFDEYDYKKNYEGIENKVSNKEQNNGIIGVTDEQESFMNNLIEEFYKKKSEEKDNIQEKVMSDDDDDYVEVEDFMNDFLKKQTDENYNDTIILINSLVNKKNKDAISKIVLEKLKNTQYYDKYQEELNNSREVQSTYEEKQENYESLLNDNDETKE